ncbi:xylose operon transcription regulator XylR [Flexithrix dorotheae]|uniref:AraC family transcriptional regulator n=1 Tax=Flexithrix dorotheae TaxID=70993 RepID=UPI00037050CA|nr:DNA-binding transcriptional regulator [Flexithrix dorotheae]
MPKVILLLDLSEEYGKHLLKGISRYIKDNAPWACCRMPAEFRKNYGVKGLIDWAKEWGAEGIIGQLETEEEVNAIKEEGIPVVVQDLRNRLKSSSSITGAYFEAGKIGAEYFIKKGYKHFAFYGFNDIVWSRERAQGFEETLKKQGYHVHYFEHSKARSRELWYYKPSYLSKWIASLPKPVALMACDDNQGQHITEACKLTGIKIPEDLAVLGVDNDEMVCNISDPPLSSIALDTEKGGYEAAELLDKMMRNGEMIQDNIIVSPTQIIERRSTDFYASKDVLVREALKFIHENIQTNLNVSDVLKQVPLSRRAMEQRFLNVTGYSPYKYICRLRIEKFCQQLLETDKTVFEIAIDNGFENSKNLSRLFKEIKGCTPVHYRKKHLVKK